MPVSASFKPLLSHLVSPHKPHLSPFKWCLLRHTSTLSMLLRVHLHRPASDTRSDGRDFFRTARQRLSYERFNTFLTNIKRLNNREQTRCVHMCSYTNAYCRDETLRAARSIFGIEGEDLYQQFCALLNRHS